MAENRPVRPQVSLHFPAAPQPDIVRSSQKDEYYKRQLNENFSEIAQYYMGPRAAMRIQDELKLASQLCYYGMSTVMGRQTLGEEYCDILQVDGNRQIPSSLLQRCSLIILQIVVPYLSSKLSIHIDRFLRPRVQTLKGKENLKEETRKKIAVWIPRLKGLLDIIQRIHVAIFYFSGVFYHIPKRIMNIKYIFNRKIDEERPTYDILGILIVLQLGISFILWVKDSIKDLRNRQNEISDAQSNVSNQSNDNLQSLTTLDISSTDGKCSLCLGPRISSTSTSCGHLFCWTCITEWCNSKSECPLCRSPQKKNELLPVYHFH